MTSPKWWSLKDRIERRLRIVWLLFRTSEPVDDFRFMVRIGFGRERKWPNIELAAFGWGFVIGYEDWRKVDSKAEQDPIVIRLNEATSKVEEMYDRYVDELGPGK